MDEEDAGSSPAAVPASERAALGLQLQSPPRSALRTSPRRWKAAGQSTLALAPVHADRRRPARELDRDAGRGHDALARARNNSWVVSRRRRRALGSTRRSSRHRCGNAAGQSRQAMARSYRLVGSEGRAGLDRGSAPVVVGGARRAVVRAAVAPGVATDPTTWIGSPEEPDGPFFSSPTASSMRASAGNFSLHDTRPSVSRRVEGGISEPQPHATPGCPAIGAAAVAAPLGGDDAKSRGHAGPRDRAIDGPRATASRPNPESPSANLRRRGGLFSRAGKQVQGMRVRSVQCLASPAANGADPRSVVKRDSDPVNAAIRTVRIVRQSAASMRFSERPRRRASPPWL